MREIRKIIDKEIDQFYTINPKYRTKNALKKKVRLIIRELSRYLVDEL